MHCYINFRGVIDMAFLKGPKLRAKTISNLISNFRGVTNTAEIHCL
jgi:hypothetical protein